MAQKNHVCKFEGCGHVCQTKRGLKKHSFAHKSKTVKTGRAADKDLSDGTRAKMRKKSHGVEDPGAYVPSPGRNWVANEERRQTKKRKKEEAQQKEEANSDVCFACAGEQRELQGGFLILCDVCTASFHLNCVSPILYSVPEGCWSCPLCLAGIQFDANEQTKTTTTLALHDSPSSSSSGALTSHDILTGRFTASSGGPSQRSYNLTRTHWRKQMYEWNSLRFNHQRCWVFISIGAARFALRVFTQFRRSLCLNTVIEAADAMTQSSTSSSSSSSSSKSSRGGNDLLKSENIIFKELVQLKLRQYFDTIDPDWRTVANFEKQLNGNGVEKTGKKYILLTTAQDEANKEMIVRDQLFTFADAKEGAPQMTSKKNFLKHRSEFITALIRDDPLVPDICKSERQAKRSASYTLQGLDPQLLLVYEWYINQLKGVHLLKLPSNTGHLLMNITSTIVDECPITSTTDTKMSRWNSDPLIHNDNKLAQLTSRGALAWMTDAVRDNLNADGCDLWRKRNHHLYIPFSIILNEVTAQQSEKAKQVQEEAKKYLITLKPPEDLEKNQKHAQSVQNTPVLHIYGDGSKCLSQNDSTVAGFVGLGLPPSMISDSHKNDDKLRKQLNQQINFVQECHQLARPPSNGSKPTAQLSANLFDMVYEKTPPEGTKLGALSQATTNIKSWQAIQEACPPFGTPVEQFRLFNAPLLDNAELTMNDDITYNNKVFFLSGDGAELLDLAAKGKGRFPYYENLASGATMGTIWGSLTSDWLELGKIEALINVWPLPDGKNFANSGVVVNGSKLDVDQVRQAVNAHRIHNGMDATPADQLSNMDGKKARDELRDFLKNARGLPEYFSDEHHDETGVRRLFGVPDAMHALAGLLHRYIILAIARLSPRQRKLLWAWAKLEGLYHSSGHMFCYSWIIFGIHLVLSRTEASYSKGQPRPVDLPEVSRVALATLLDLRQWCYMDAVNIRKPESIFLAHAALIHFLIASEAFAKAVCAPGCRCKKNEPCFPGDATWSTVFGGTESGGGVYFSGVVHLILLLRILASVWALCETPESFFATLGQLVECTNRQWGNMIRRIPEKLNAIRLEKVFNRTESMETDKRLRTAVSDGIEKLNDPNNGSLKWKVKGEDGLQSTFTEKQVHSMAYIQVWIQLTDYWIYQHLGRGKVCDV